MCTYPYEKNYAEEVEGKERTYAEKNSPIKINTFSHFCLFVHI